MSALARMETVILASAGAAVIRGFGFSYRIRRRGEEFEAQAREHNPNVIYAFWHGRLLPPTYALRDRSIHVLASQHRDGERLGQTIRRLGYGHVRGSSTRGGVRAIYDLVRKNKEGFDLGFAADGPRGPRFVAKAGSVQVAKMSGAAILPITSASRSHKTFTSWDAFELPYPFTKVTVAYGEPVMVPPDADSDTIEEKRLELENNLNAVTRKIDEEYHG
jgi:lysophospholipid acyltransferase (LPLAT)-like uncharacterized protein